MSEVKSIRGIDNSIFERFKRKAKKEGWIIGILFNKLMKDYIGGRK